MRCFRRRAAALIYLYRRRPRAQAKATRPPPGVGHAPGMDALLFQIASNATLPPSSANLGFSFGACPPRPQGPAAEPCPLELLQEPRDIPWMQGRDRTDQWLYQTLFCDKCPLAVGNKGRRTYVELGANDGLAGSNTHVLERHLNWGGVLIEGHPHNAKHLLRNRKDSGRNIVFPEAVCNHTGVATFAGPAGYGTAGLASEFTEAYRRKFGHRLTATFPALHIRSHAARSVQARA